MSLRFLCCVSMLGFAAVVSVQTQSLRNLPEEQFEAIAIRSNNVDTRPSGGMQPNGRLNIRATTVVQLLVFAYNGLVIPERMIGIPDWAQRERFDIVATSGRQVDDDRALFRGLLSDRFKLRSHVEQREVAVYIMTARPGGKFGAGLRRTSIDCSNDAAVDRARAEQKSGEPRPCGGFTKAGEVAMGGATMNLLASMLSTQLGRPVLNRTELDGRFDMTMTWSPNLVAGADLATDDRSGLFTAVQEQLGLRLQPERAPIDVLVIDHIERPTEN
jgi:uncharacterized protein (TIGR03435 family)